MTDRELEERLRAWYATEVAEGERAPADLHERVTAVPVSTPMPLRPLARRRNISLLAVAAVLVVGGGLAAGAGLVRLTSVVPPAPSDALRASIPPSPSEGPSDMPSDTPSPTANVRPGGLIAFTRIVDKQRTCSGGRTLCPTSRVWTVGADGRDAHELLPDGVGSQSLMGWSPDGAHLLFMDGRTLYVADPSGGQRQAVDTGCEAPVTPTPSVCLQDSGLTFSPDGRRLAFVRESSDAEGYSGLVAITTMDLETGSIAVLNSTLPDGGWKPGWSPDGSQIVFSRYPENVPGQDMAAIFVIDADGQNMHQVSPTTLAAQDAAWSPDGSRLAFVSPKPDDPGSDFGFGYGDIYTIRPDGTDVRRLTTGGTSAAPVWTADGRILFTRAGPGSDPGWWLMDADGTNARIHLSASEIGVAPEALLETHPAWQPIGGAAIVPAPWTPAPGVAVGPPAPTPAPTPTPDLAPGFAWTGSPTTDAASPLGDTTTLLADGRVLVTAVCGTAAELYDPATGTFSPTGSMTADRAYGTATLLDDGRVLVAGGYNCGVAGKDGIWASAELYDPATGTFSPTGRMKAPREFHTATRLADGRVLMAGGFSGPSPTAGRGIVLASLQTAETASSVLASAEVYDPATGTFSKTGSMSTFRDNHTATLLDDGRVLVTGGGGEGYASSTSADVYDPSSGRFTKTGPMKTGRWLHSATLLRDGRVLILGGRSPQDSVYAKAETYDPRTGRFTSAGSMTDGRQQHTATLLTDGRVLIAGGYWSDGKSGHALSSTETYDPATGIFSPNGSMGALRNEHGAVRMADGRVLIVGGEDTGGGRSAWVASAVLYQP